MEFVYRPASSLRHLRLPIYSDSPDFLTGVANFDKPRPSRTKAQKMPSAQQHRSPCRERIGGKIIENEMKPKRLLWRSATG
jgi:hypothetical protein